MCRSTNGVSRKHGEVSRALWQKLFPGKTVADVPITHVTNGVHVPTWISPLLRWVFEKYMGEDWDAKLLDQVRGVRSSKHARYERGIKFVIPCRDRRVRCENTLSTNNVHSF